MLCQPHISSHVLSTFSHLAKQRNKIFLENLEAIQDQIIGMYDFCCCIVLNIETRYIREKREGGGKGNWTDKYHELYELAL